MAKKTVKKKPFDPSSDRERKLSFSSVTKKKQVKSDRELFFDLFSKREVSRKVVKGDVFKKYKRVETIKSVAKKFKVSERTFRSYYKYLSGQEMGKNDRKPPEKFLKKIKPVVKKVNSKIKNRKEKITFSKAVTMRVTQVERVKQVDFISKAQKKVFKDKLVTLGKKYSYTAVRMNIKYFKRDGNTFNKFQTVVSYFTNVEQIMEQVQDYLNALLMPYIVKAEIVSIYFEVIGRKNKNKR